MAISLVAAPLIRADDDLKHVLPVEQRIGETTAERDTGGKLDNDDRVSRPTGFPSEQAQGQVPPCMFDKLLRACLSIQTRHMALELIVGKNAAAVQKRSPSTPVDQASSGAAAVANPAGVVNNAAVTIGGGVNTPAIDTGDTFTNAAINTAGVNNNAAINMGNIANAMNNAGGVNTPAINTVNNTATSTADAVHTAVHTAGATCVSANG